MGHYCLSFNPINSHQVIVPIVKDIVFFQLFTQKLIRDLGVTSSKNPSERLVQPVWELAKLAAKTSSKVWEFKTYDEAINDLIYGNR